MAATATHRITMPKKISNMLAKRAKAGNTTLSGAFLAIVEDALDDDPISEEEERQLVERAERNEERSKGKRLYTHKEAWGL